MRDEGEKLDYARRGDCVGACSPIVSERFRHCASTL